MIKGFLDLPWFVWAGLALIIAAVYSFIWLQKTGITVNGFRFFILRWGQAITWMLLAINFLLRGVSSSLNGAADIIALAGGLAYFLFMIMAFVVK